MNKVEVNKYEDINYFIWDNTDETIEMVNDYLKEVKGDNWHCIRNWEEKTNSNTGDVLCICVKNGDMSSNSFYRVGDYVMDFYKRFAGYNKKEFDSKIYIETYKNYKEFIIN